MKCLTLLVSFITIACGKCPNTIQGPPGQAGTQGVAGIQGPTGNPGQDAPTLPFNIIGLVNPCGDAPGIYDEVFLKLADGTLIASFSADAQGDNTRFSVLTPGNYVTTDGDSCYFTIATNGDIINESHRY